MISSWLRLGGSGESSEANPGMWWEVAPRRSLGMARPYLNTFLAGGGEREEEGERAWDGRVRMWFEGRGGVVLTRFRWLEGAESAMVGAWFSI